MNNFVLNFDETEVQMTLNLFLINDQVNKKGLGMNQALLHFIANSSESSCYIAYA
jgi:hypothetical protein